MESFVGLGQTRDEAIFNGFEKFLNGTFHVLLETMCGHSCGEDQSDSMVWRTPGHSWNVCSSALLSGADPLGPAMARQCREFMQSLESLATDLLPDRIHWFRVFIGVFKGEIAAIEVLLDNENWARGEALARAWDWVRPEGYTSVRAFAVCSPAPPESAAG